MKGVFGAERTLYIYYSDQVYAVSLKVMSPYRRFCV